MPGVPNFDMIVNTKRSATACSYQAMEMEFRSIVRMIESNSSG
jgi:hypothetical protein